MTEDEYNIQLGKLMNKKLTHATKAGYFKEHSEEHNYFNKYWYHIMAFKESLEVIEEFEKQHPEFNF